MFGSSIGYFTPGDAAELEGQIRYYLAHPGLMREMAEESQERVQGQNYTDRIQQILNVVDVPARVGFGDAKPLDRGTVVQSP